MVEGLMNSLNGKDGGVRTERPEVIGKPNPYTLELIMQEHSLKAEDRSKMLMIGDRMDTDILFGNNSGIDTCLVFTGVTQSEADATQKFESDAKLKPTYFMQSFGAFE